MYTVEGICSMELNATNNKIWKPNTFDGIIFRWIIFTIQHTAFDIRQTQTSKGFFVFENFISVLFGHSGILCQHIWELLTNRDNVIWCFFSVWKWIWVYSFVAKVFTVVTVVFQCSRKSDFNSNSNLLIPSLRM